MAKQLYLYKGFTPNLGQGEHLLVDNMAGLVSAMALYRQQTVDLDNYRINNGVASVKPTSTMKDYLTMSYAIEYDTVGKFGRAYFIKSAQPRADYIDYELDLDHWGTFMHDASIQDLIIRRTNRNIGTGIYDKIEVAGAKTVDIYPNTNSVTAGTYSLVILCNETVKTSNLSILTEQTTSRQKLYYLGWPANTYEFPRILAGLEIAQNIYQREIVSGWNPVIKVLKAWIIPADMIAGVSGASPVVLNYVDPTSGNQVSASGYEVAPGKKTYTIASLTTDPNYIYYAGTSKQGSLLTNITASQDICYDFISKVDGMQVLLRVGENVEDITTAFEVGLSINEGQSTGLEALTSAISTLGAGAGVAATITGALAPEVGSLAALAMIGSAANQVQRLSSKAPTRHVPGGDGVVNIMNETGATIFLQSVYRIVKYQSKHNESTHARLKGAVFNIPYASLHGLKTETLLGTGLATDDTYVEADCEVMNIQSDAASVIREKLHNGVYIWDQMT